VDPPTHEIHNIKSPTDKNEFTVKKVTSHILQELYLSKLNLFVLYDCIEYFHIL